MKNVYYSEKDKRYFSYYREDLHTLIKRFGKFNRVLDIGCGNGDLLARLKEDNLANQIIGIDPFVLPNEIVNLDEFSNDSIENVLSKLKECARFDLIIFADVLEHLEDPWKIFNTVCKNNLNNNGMVIISIPNFRNIWTLFRIILLNSFNYQKEGVLDKTHLRFFCKNDIEQLLVNAELEIILLTQNFKYKKSIFFKKNRLKIVNMLTLNIMPFWISDSILAVARKK